MAFSRLYNVLTQSGAALDKYQVEKEIRKAETLPGRFYRDPEVWRQLLERGFASSWQTVLPEKEPQDLNSCAPFTLLPGSLDEPLILSRDENGQLSAMSNVCTHRGNLLVEKVCSRGTLRCAYHGRTFEMDGSFKAMPGFEGVENFPTEKDDLTRVNLHRFGPLDFVSLDQKSDFSSWIDPVIKRTGHLPWAQLKAEDKPATVYELKAHWALYLENYLEGFHIPFVHPELNATLDANDYPLELFPQASLQMGMASSGQPCFNAPQGHQDHGKKVAAYYFWLWPNTLINLYPWGLSLNLVQPVAPDETRVLFKSFIWDESLRDQGAGGPLHTVELQDENVVEAVQRGVRSRLYDRGRFSPEHEGALHHFQRLLCECLN